MKKFKLLIIIGFLGIFLNLVPVNAEVLTRTNIGNGKVQLTLNSNHGYIGALDATIQLSKEVTFSKIEWDSSLNDLAMKEYQVNNSDNTIHILLVTKNTEQNLLDKDGNLKIGMIEVKSNKTTEYNITLKSLTMTNFDFEEAEIKNLEVGGEETLKFTQEQTSSPTPTPTPTSTPTQQPTPTNNPSPTPSSSVKPTSTPMPTPTPDHSNSTQNNENQIPTSGNVSSDENNNQPDETEKQPSDEKNEEVEQNPNHNSTTENNTENEQDELKKNNNWFLLVGILMVVTSVTGLGIILIKGKNKNE